MLRYKSEHPNHVHQLTVCASKHYYVTKDRRLKYQGKPMEIRLENVTQSERTHLVHYLIRDHFSGLFFSEVVVSNHLAPIGQFLNRAWSKKNDLVLCGIPDLLTVPRTVEAVFPTIRESVTELGVRFVDVTSGFQGGVRDIQTVENWLLVACGRPVEIAYQRVRQFSQDMSLCKSRDHVTDKATYWQKHVPPVRFPPDRWGYET